MKIQVFLFNLVAGSIIALMLFNHFESDDSGCNNNNSSFPFAMILSGSLLTIGNIELNNKK